MLIKNRGNSLYLKRLELSNFRNYRSLKLELKPGLNMFIGTNAQGKTNLLESIYFLSCGSSYRTADNKEANFIVVMFSPQDLDIVRSSPVYRRQFLDRILNQINPEYRHHFERHQRILNQRNSLLKLFHLTGNRKKIVNTIDLWNRLFVTSGSFIIMERIKLLEILNNLAKGVIDKIPINGKLEICYSTSMSVEKKDKIKDIEDEMLRKLKERQKRDISIGVTTIGPHRYDIKITIGGRDARHYGSGGQQRMKSKISTYLVENGKIKVWQ